MALRTFRPRSTTGLILLALGRLLEQDCQRRRPLHFLLLTLLNLLPGLNCTLTPHTLTPHRPHLRYHTRGLLPPNRPVTASSNTPTPLLPRSFPDPLLSNPRRLRRNKLAINACSDAPRLLIRNPASPALNT